jgi:hypothetical protein
LLAEIAHDENRLGGLKRKPFVWLNEGRITLGTPLIHVFSSSYCEELTKTLYVGANYWC